MVIGVWKKNHLCCKGTCIDEFMRSCSLWHWGNETVGKFCAVVYSKLLSTAKGFIVIQNFLKAAYWFQFSHEAYSHLFRYPQRAAMFNCHKNVIYFLCARKRGLSILQSCFPISQDSIISYAFLCAVTNEISLLIPHRHLQGGNSSEY